jgi:hypothetical protein
MLNELALQGMQLLAIGQAFHRFNLRTLRFRTEHKARADETVIHDDAASATIARAATFLGTGEPKPVAQHIEQRFGGITDEVGRIAIDRS